MDTFDRRITVAAVPNYYAAQFTRALTGELRIPKSGETLPADGDLSLAADYRTYFPAQRIFL